MRRCSFTAVLLVALLTAQNAQATFSIVAADGTSKRVGGAGASCLGGGSVSIIYASAPGLGAVHAQAWINVQARDEAQKLLMEGQTPPQVLNAITNPSFDANSAQRQYGIVHVTSPPASFTGTDALDYASDLTGTDGTISYSIQGNILTSERVLLGAQEAFVGSGCDLPDKLMQALMAAEQNGGDSRCADLGLAADSAFIRVDSEAGDEPLLSLTVDGFTDSSPIGALSQAFGIWRAEHPCPVPSTEDGSCTCSSTQPDTGLFWALALIVTAASRRCWARGERSHRASPRSAVRTLPS